MYAIQHRNTGDFIFEVKHLSDANKILQDKNFEAIDIDNASKLEVWYTEIGGPHGYGEHSPEFITHGSLLRVVINFYKWVQRTTKVFGPDWRDVRDFFNHCNLTINGQDKTSWLIKEVDKLNRNKIFI